MTLRMVQHPAAALQCARRLNAAREAHCRFPTSAARVSARPAATAARTPSLSSVRPVQATVQMLKTLRFVSLTCAAIVLGLTLAHVLEAPGKRQLSGAEWVVVQNTFYPGFAVLGGVGEVAGLLCSGALAMMERHRRFGGVLAAVAAIAFAGTLLSYAFGNRPINDQVAVWTAASLPPDWTSYRDRWDAAHTLAAALSAIAFVTLLVAALADSSVVGRRTCSEAVRHAHGLGATIRARLLNDDPAAGDLSSRHASHVPEPRPAAAGRASITRTAIIVSGDAERCLTEGRVAQAGRHLVGTARGGALQLQQILVNRANCDWNPRQPRQQRA
jgi:hypothetical protein